MMGSFGLQHLFEEASVEAQLWNEPNSQEGEGRKNKRIPTLKPGRMMGLFL